MRALASVVLLSLITAACSDPDYRPTPTIANVVDTVTLYAISGTPVALPSGYAVTQTRAVRLDQSSVVDFAYDRLPDGRRIFLPGVMLGLPAGPGEVPPGIQHTTQAFDAITVAELNGYRTLDTTFVAAGDVLLVRGRVPSNCFLLLPSYAKLEVLSFDDSERSVTFQVLANVNCGYRGLVPGLPTQ